MANLNEESIRLLGKLCRIEIPDADIPNTLESLKKILDHVEMLQQVDVSDLGPHSHMNEQGIDSLRDDKAYHSLKREEFLANAPDQVAGMIRVPPVMKQHV